MEALAIDTVWVVVAGCLVLFMQAGFAMLEVGFSRMKNAGAVMAKVLINLCLAFAVFWAIGYAIAFGDGGDFLGATGWFIELGNADGVPSLAYSAVDENTKWFFQATFAAVTLAIVWGSMLDRVRFGAYAPFAVLFVGLIYPIVVHWQWGGGWLFQHGYQDFAGSGVVHLCGATAAFAGAMIIGPRIGKFREGKAVPIPGHSMPLAILGVLILWVGWQGFNAGSWLAAVGADLGRVIVVTNLSGIFGVIGATIVARLLLGHARHRDDGQRRDRGARRDRRPVWLRGPLGRGRDRAGRRLGDGAGGARSGPDPRGRPDRGGGRARRRRESSGCSPPAS